MGKNYTNNFRQKVEPPLNQQEGMFIDCYEFHSPEDQLLVTIKTQTENVCKLFIAELGVYHAMNGNDGWISLVRNKTNKKH